MAFAFVEDHGGAAIKTPGDETTITMSPATAIPAGALCILRAATDNLATTSGLTTGLSVTDSQGNTWTRALENTRTEAGALKDGATYGIFYSVLATGLGTGDTITLTISPAVSARAIGLKEYSIGASSVQVDGSDHLEIAAGAEQTLTISGLANVEHLFLAGHSAERLPGNDNPTNDPDYGNFAEFGTSGAGGNLGNITMQDLGLRILTATSESHVYTPGAAADRAIGFVALSEAGGESHSGTAAISGGGRAVAAVEKNGQSAASASGGGAATATGEKAISDAATIAAGGSVTAAGQKGALSKGLAAADDGCVTADDSRVGADGQVTTIILCAGGSVTATGTAIEARQGTAALSGGGSVSTQVSAGRQAAVAISGGGLAVAIGQKGAQGTAAISGGGTITAVGVAGAPEEHTGTSAISGGGSVSASGQKNALAGAQIGAGGTAQGVGTTARSQASAISGGGSLLVAHTTSRSTVSVISGGGSVSATGPFAGGSVVISGGGSVTVKACRLFPIETVSVAALVAPGEVGTITTVTAAEVTDPVPC